MTLSDLDRPFHALRAVCAVAELFAYNIQAILG